MVADREPRGGRPFRVNHSEQRLSDLLSCFSLGQLGVGRRRRVLGTELFYCAYLKAISCCLRGMKGRRQSPEHGFVSMEAGG